MKNSWKGLFLATFVTSLLFVIHLIPMWIQDRHPSSYGWGGLYVLIGILDLAWGYVLFEKWDDL